MSLTVKEPERTGGDFKIVDAGTHTAVCTQIIDTGPEETPWGDKDKVYLRWEIPGERVEWEDSDGNKQEGPAIIWANYTASLAEKANLRKILESWRGRKFTQEELNGFDLKSILGVPCTLSIVHNESKNGRTYANVASVSGLMKGMEKPKPEGEVFAFDIDAHTSEELAKLPDWLKDKVEEGKRLQAKQREDFIPPASENPAPPGVDDGFADDDIPF